jgi:hypothetical protein
MKHLLQEWGVNPLVIPNGLSTEALIRPERQAVAAFRARLRHRTVLCKVARWDPDKRWLLAIAIVSALKQQGWQPRWSDGLPVGSNTSTQPIWRNTPAAVGWLGDRAWRASS